MRKAYIFLIAVFLLLFLLVYSFSKSVDFDSSYYAVENKNGIIQSIASYIFVPIIHSRIDFHLKNTGIITNLERYKYDNKILEIEDVKIGEGKSILCGEEVLVKFEKSERKIKLGTDEIKALNIGLLGMKEGGTRKITVPSLFSERITGEKDKKKSYQVTLKKKLSSHPESNLLIFESIRGNKRAIMCGDEVTLKYRARDVKGNFIKDGLYSFKVGEGKAPVGFELGVLEMVPNSPRTIVSPPNLLDENFLQDQVNIIDLIID